MWPEGKYLGVYCKRKEWFTVRPWVSYEDEMVDMLDEFVARPAQPSRGGDFWRFRD